jgi:predicted transcriptional regulator with HTH domain
VQVWRRVGGSYTQQNSWGISNIGTAWHTLEIRIKGTAYKVYHDGSYLGNGFGREERSMGTRQMREKEVKMNKSSRFTAHSSPITDYLFRLLAVIVVMALLSVGISGGTGAQAQAGYITSTNIIASSQTDHWQGYYGALSLSPNATKYPEYSITGTGSDSGTNTFTDIGAFYNIPIRGNIQNVPTVYINGTGPLNFREGLLKDGNNSVFIVPIEEAMPGYNGTPCNFQFILPTNYSNPITYYIYYLARPSALVTRHSARHTSNSTPPPAPDTTPPKISNVTVTIERSVIITWDTNEKSDSRVKCGMESGEYTIEEHNTSYTLFHVIPLKQIRLENIHDNTTYYFVVNSTDPSGNSAQTEEYIFVLTPPEHRRAIVPFILQIPPTLYPHMWWLLLETIIVLIITVIVLSKYKSRRNFNSLIGKPVGTEILMYLYTTFPTASRPADISGRTNIDLNGVLEALHNMSNKNTLERLLGIGLVDTAEWDGKECYRISKRGKSLIEALKWR